MRYIGKKLLTTMPLLVIPLALVVALSFSQGLAQSQPQSEEGEQILQALQMQGYDVTSVQAEGDNLKVVYRQSALQDQATHPYSWLDMMTIALELHSGARVVTIDVDYMEEPFFSVSAQASEIQAVSDGVISPPEFFEGLWFTERRNLDSALSQELQHLGYPYSGYSLEGQTLRIPMTAAVMANGRDMLPSAIEIAALAAGKAPDIDRFEISFSGPGGDVVRLTIHRSDLQAYEQGSIAELALIAAVEAEVEPAMAVRAPTLGRFLAGGEAVIATVAGLFYGLAGWRRKSWSLPIKGILFVAFPALVASIGMLLLIP